MDVKKVGQYDSLTQIEMEVKKAGQYDSLAQMEYITGTQLRVTISLGSSAPFVWCSHDTTPTQFDHIDCTSWKPAREEVLPTYVHLYLRITLTSNQTILLRRTLNPFTWPLARQPAQATP